MVFLGYKRGTKGYQCFDPITHKIHLSHDVIFEEGCKWNFIKSQPSEGMPFKELCVLGVEIQLKSLRERMEESGESVEVVLHYVSSNREVDQSQGSTSTRDAG